MFILYKVYIIVILKDVSFKNSIILDSYIGLNFYLYNEVLVENL